MKKETHIERMLLEDHLILKHIIQDSKYLINLLKRDLLFHKEQDNQIVIRRI